MGELNRRSRQRLTIRRQALEIGDRGRLVPIGGVDDPALVEAVLVPTMTTAAADGGARGAVPVPQGAEAMNRLLRKAAGLE
jgi:putative N-acetylmannosamine-6-phosphate epimerase